MRWWWILLSAPAALGPPAPAGDPPAADAAVLRRIQDLRERASKIKVDGRRGDWEGIPSFEDRDPAAIADDTRDIARISVAPREWDVLVMIETAGVPSRAPYAFVVDVDFLGHDARDAHLRFGAKGGTEVSIHPEGGKPFPLSFPRIEVAFGEVVEIRIPLDPLVNALGGADGKAWIEGTRRSFVRVQAWTEAPGTGVRVDEGPAAASFRLVAPPFLPDAPLAPDAEPVRAVGFPLEGKWYLRQGDHGLWSHQEIWAYDLALVDHALAPTATAGSRDLDAYYAWGKPVRAPEAGEIAFDNPPVEDHAPLAPSAGRDSGNTIILRMEDGMRLFFGHLKRDSTPFGRGEKVPDGAVLGRVGNSGDSGAPHLHLSLHERPGDFLGLPLAFRKVRVGLNPGPDDPWARDLASWAAREGWFVEGR